MNQRHDELRAIRHLRKRAKHLLTAARAGEPEAVARIERFAKLDGGEVRLMFVYWVVAQELGYRDWAAVLAAHPLELEARLKAVPK